MTLRRCLVGVLVVVVVMMAVACSSAKPPAVSTNPLAGVHFYVDPGGHAVQQVKAWKQAGDTKDAQALKPIADQPTAVWFGADKGDPRTAAAELTKRAAAAKAVPIFTIYNLPQRDCGQYSSGGAPSVESYQGWLWALGQGIGTNRAVVILEPDAIAQALVGCGGSASAGQRYQLLASAVGTLRAEAPQARVYIDAGNPNWINDLDALADALRQSGVAQAAGFALNTSNFVSTKDNETYGGRLSQLLGGAHFVVDTSRNGAGPDASNNWCNPPGRALGERPTTNAKNPLVDALLWVKQPGDSDGTCVPGAPKAGEWWASYALDLVRSGPKT